MAYKFEKCTLDMLYTDSVMSVWKWHDVLGFSDSSITYVVRCCVKNGWPKYRFAGKVHYSTVKNQFNRLLNGDGVVPMGRCWKPLVGDASTVEGIEYMRIDTMGNVIAPETFDAARCSIPEDGLIEKVNRTEGAYMAFVFANDKITAMQRIVFMKDYPKYGSVKVILDTNL